MPDNVAFFLLAVFVFILFVAIAILSGITSKKLASQEMNRLHLLLSPLYFLGCWLLGLPWNLDTAVGFLSYFFFQYLYFLFFFGIPRRSFSVNLCISLFELNGHGTVTDLLEKYGEGKGIKQLEQTRQDAMVRNKMIYIKDGQIYCSSFGKACVLLHRLILKIWGFK